MKQKNLKLTVLLLTLIVGIGQMKADQWMRYGVWWELSYNSTTWSATHSVNDDTLAKKAIGTLSTDLVVSQCYWKNTTNWNVDHTVNGLRWSLDNGSNWSSQTMSASGSNSGTGDNQYYQLGSNDLDWKLVDVESNSGNFTMQYEFWAYYYYNATEYGENQSWAPGNTNKFTLTYTILPPDPTAISVTASSGSIGGDGSAGSPFLVQHNGSLTLSTSGTPAHNNDGNSSLYVKYGSDSYSGTTTKTISSITSTDAQYIDVEIKYYNSGASLSSATPRTKRVYYKVATYAITLDDNGSYLSDGSATAAYKRTTLTNITAPRRTGYHVDGYYGEAGTTTHISDASGNLQASKTVSTTPYTDKDSQWLKQSATTLYTKWAANTYDVTLKANTGTGDDQVVQATYDADMPTTLKGSSDAVTVHTKTGYDLLGYWDATSDGNQYYSYNVGTSTLSSYRTWNKTSNTDLYAHWDAKTYTITIDVDEANKGTTTSATCSVTATYDATMPSIGGSLPIGANGYRYMGLYTNQNGGGVALTDSLNNWLSDVDDYISEGNWVHDGAITVYAYYKKAEVTRLRLSPSSVAPEGTVTATPTIYPTPEGSYKLCWKILRANGNLLTDEGFTDGEGNSVTFAAPSASGSYKVACILRTGSVCGSGTRLDSIVADLVVAGEHTVTVRYQDSDGRTLAASIEITGKPLEWTAVDAITPPTITGYTFDHWNAGDGVTIKNGESDPVTTTTTSSIQIKAVYDGTLTAVYNKKKMIYFNNTLGWSNVYVYFYSNNKYWDTGKTDTYNTEKGCGANKDWEKEGTKPYINKCGEMTPIAGTNIWYYDYVAAGISDYTNIVFCKDNQDGYANFYSTEVVRIVDGFTQPTNLPMYVPLTSSTQIANKTADDTYTTYYLQGYWMNYPENTGYTLKIYNSTSYGTSDQLQSIPFVFTGDKKLPMSVTVSLNDGRDYGFEIHRNDGTVLGKTAKMQINNSGDTGETPWKLTTGQRTGIHTSVAGNYEFTLNFGDASGYGYLIGVHYPVAVNDYRIVYNDRVKWSKSTAHAATYIHPSRAIHKENGATDTVSFYVSKAEGANASMKFQYAYAIDGSGNVDWRDTTGGTISLSSIEESGVYNFILSQSANGIISVSKIEPYTGNYYIRTDCAGSTKWENYRASDHQMTYSEFSKNSRTNTFGELYTHYYMHWCPRGTNVKFTVANDYSMCISDTLIQDSGDPYSNIYENDGGGRADGELKAESYDGSGNITSDETGDKYSANIRFMYNESTNKISRAYMSSSTNASRKFLVLRSNAEFKNTDDSSLSGSGETADDENDIWEAIFADDEDWIYEREVKVTPGSKFKLYASYAQTTPAEDGSQHFRGQYASNDWTNTANYVELIGGTGDPCNSRIVYDFKTNRLMSAYQPEEGEIEGTHAIKADIMLVRNHQEAGQQLIFKNEEAALTDVMTVYGVMRFNRWILNNRQHPEDMDRNNTKTDELMNTNHPVITDPGDLKSASERGLYWISFPFNVNLSEVFGFGTYGTDWIIMYYDGEKRAREGYWQDSEGFWTYIWDRRGVTLEAGKGYVLALDLDRMHADNRTFWANEIQQIELFFPSSTTGTTIQQTNVDITVPSYPCTIDRTGNNGANINKNRTIADSHWNVIGVPSYANYGTTLTSDGSTVITWNSTPATYTLPYLYEWNANDNSYTVQGGTKYPFKTMHSYMVQYNGHLYWSLASATPSGSSVAARQTDVPDKEYMLSLIKDSLEEDHTFVRMSDKEGVTTGFEFGQDLCKEYNGNKGNIYTFVGYLPVAGNSMPHPLTTTIVPVGVKIAANGEYTFSMPEGTNGGDVWLIDNANSSRTNLGLMDYTVNLTTGTYEGRFSLEFPVQNVVTDIENAANANANANAEARKVFVGGRLYILRDGKAYDATGAQVR